MVADPKSKAVVLPGVQFRRPGNGKGRPGGILPGAERKEGEEFIPNDLARGQDKKDDAPRSNLQPLLDMLSRIAALFAVVSNPFAILAARLAAFHLSTLLNAECERRIAQATVDKTSSTEGIVTIKAQANTLQGESKESVDFWKEVISVQFVKAVSRFNDLAKGGNA